MSTLMKFVSFLILLIVGSTSAFGQNPVIKGTGILYWNNIPTVDASLPSGSEWGYVLGNKTLYYFDRDSSNWLPYRPPGRVFMINAISDTTSIQDYREGSMFVTSGGALGLRSSAAWYLLQATANNGLDTAYISNDTLFLNTLEQDYELVLPTSSGSGVDSFYLNGDSLHLETAGSDFVVEVPNLYTQDGEIGEDRTVDLNTFDLILSDGTNSHTFNAGGYTMTTPSGGQFLVDVSSGYGLELTSSLLSLTTTGGGLVVAPLSGLGGGNMTLSYQAPIFVTSTSYNEFQGTSNRIRSSSSATAGQLWLLEGSANGANYIGLRSPATLSTNTLYTFPSDGSNGQLLKTNGSGILSWVNDSTVEDLFTDGDSLRIIVAGDTLSTEISNIYTQNGTISGDRTVATLDHTFLIQSGNDATVEVTEDAVSLYTSGFASEVTVKGPGAVGGDGIDIISAGTTRMDGTDVLLIGATSTVLQSPYVELKTASGSVPELRFKEAVVNGLNYIGLKAAASIAANIVWALPAADGAAGTFLQTNGSGVLSFASTGLADSMAIVRDSIDALRADIGTGGGGGVSGSGTTNRLVKWSSSTALTNAGLTDNGTDISALLPFTFPSYTTAGLPTGAAGKMVYNSTIAGPTWHNGTNWLNSVGISATFTSGQVAFANAVNTLTGSNNLFWNSATNRLSINRGTNPTFSLDVDGNARIGLLALETNGFAGATGQGISVNASGRTLGFVSQGGINADNSSYYSFSPYGGSGSLTQSGDNRTTSFVDFLGTFSAANRTGTKFPMLRIRPTYNFAVSAGAVPAVEVTGIAYEPTLTSMYVSGHNFMKINSGNILFGVSGSGVFGYGTTSPNVSSILDFVSTSKGVLLPRMTTTNRNTVPRSVASATVTAGGTGYTTQPTCTITGGSGSGAIAFAYFSAGAITSIAILNPGEGYTSTPTITITGGGGSGATATVTLSTLPESLLLYNTDSTAFEFLDNSLAWQQLSTRAYARNQWLGPKLAAGDVTINGAVSSDLRIQNTRVQFDGKFKVGADSTFVHDAAQDTTFIGGAVNTGRIRYARFNVHGTDASNPSGINQFQLTAGNTIKHGWEVDNVSIVGGGAFTNVNFIEYNLFNHFYQSATLDFSSSYGRITQRFGRIYPTNQYAAKAIFTNNDTLTSRNEALFQVTNSVTGSQLEIYRNRSVSFPGYGTPASYTASALGKTEGIYVPRIATDGTIITKAQQNNVVSATTDASGDITVTFGTAMPDATYSVSVQNEIDGSYSDRVHTKTTTSFKIRTYDTVTGVELPAGNTVTYSWFATDY